jgi:hypothetical protein
MTIFLTPVASNLGAVVETTKLASHPFGVDRDGRSYVPTGDGGILGYQAR